MRREWVSGRLGHHKEPEDRFCAPVIPRGQLAASRSKKRTSSFRNSFNGDCRQIPTVSASPHLYQGLSKSNRKWRNKK